VIHTTAERLAEQLALIQEIRHAESQAHHWRRVAEQHGLEPGQRRAARAQAGWYAQQLARRRSELAERRRADG